MFSTVAVPLYNPSSSAQGPLSPHTCRYLLSVVFLIIAVLTGVKYLIVILIYFYLMISDVEYVFMCLLATCMSLKKCSGFLLIFLKCIDL